MAEIALSDAGAHTRLEHILARDNEAPGGHGRAGGTWCTRVVPKGRGARPDGLVFGLIVALVLVLLSDTGPMKWLARQGSDFGMRLYAWRRGDNLYDRYKALLKPAAEKEEGIEKALARVNEGQIFFTLLSIVPAEGIMRSEHGAADEQLHIEDGILKPRIPFFPIFRRELAGDGWTTVPFAADVLFNLELLCAAPSMVVHQNSLYLYFKRDGSITQGPDTAQTAERGYAAILHLLESGALRLSEEVRAAAPAEFTANRRINQLFRHYMLSGRCASLEDFLDMTQNGRAPCVKAELARLSEEPACAA